MSHDRRKRRIKVPKGFPLANDRSDSWKLRAACRQLNPELFYPERGEKIKTEIALAHCWSCPVREACLEDALRCLDVWGIRGGYTGARREAMLRNCQSPDVA